MFYHSSMSIENNRNGPVMRRTSVTSEAGDEGDGEEQASRQERISVLSNFTSSCINTPQFTEDEIGVTLDYQPPLETNTDNASAASDTGGDATVRTTQSTSAESTPFWRRLKLPTRRRVRKLCQRNWLGQFISGIFTGFIFFTIGIVFIVYFGQLPDYIGVLFIMVGFPPCCMSVNKWRMSRRERRLRNRIETRTMNLRVLHRELRDEDAYRNSELPQADLPPSYSNFAYESEEVSQDQERRSGTRSTSSYQSVYDVALPSYRDVLSEQKLKEAGIRRDSVATCNSEANVPKYEEIEQEINTIQGEEQATSFRNDS